MFQIPSYCCGMFQTFINSFLGNKTTSNIIVVFLLPENELINKNNNIIEND